MKNIATLLILSLFAIPVNAELDKYQQSALEKTQKLLKNSSQRMKAVNESPEAQAAHRKAQNLLGSEQNVDKAYNMAAQMLGVIAKEANGDPDKMKQILNQARNNPAALAGRMPAEFKSMLKEMAKDIENKSSPLRN